MLLLHSVNAAASAYEMKPILDQIAGQVFAPDLPGFGFSERSDRDYSPQLYTTAIGDMLDVIGSEPVDAIALSLSCEFLARAARAWPARFRRLVFITPTGFQKGAAQLRQQPGATRQITGLLPALSAPVLSDALFAMLVSRPSIRYFLQRTWGSKQIDEGLVEYAHATAHQPGAKFAPLAFLSGKLFSADIRNVYEGLTHPVWMPHGTRGDFSDFSEADWLAGRKNWRRQPFASGAMVHFERREEFQAQLQAFLSGAPADKGFDAPAATES